MSQGCPLHHCPSTLNLCPASLLIEHADKQIWYFNGRVQIKCKNFYIHWFDTCLGKEKNILNHKHFLKPIIFNKYYFFLVTSYIKSKNVTRRPKSNLSKIIFRQNVRKSTKLFQARQILCIEGHGPILIRVTFSKSLQQNCSKQAQMYHPAESNETFS